MTAEPTVGVGDSISSQPYGAAHRIASRAHLAGFMLIVVGLATVGFWAQHAPAGNAAPSNSLADHGKAIHIYLIAMLMDWGLFYYCWVGTHRAGNRLSVLTGERWRSWRSVFIDLVIAVPFWLLWEGAARLVHRLLGVSSAKTVDSLLPQSAVEILLWALVSITAGFCEEIAFRGYLQKQLQSFGLGVALAVGVQGIIFGIAHAYQGWHAVIVITILGVMYGALAAWRRNLRINIATHAFTDLWEGWLKFVVFK